MGFKTKGIASFIAAGAVAAVCVGPASAAPGPALTVQTDAGTSCTIQADYAVGGGVLVKPIDFSGDIDCSAADPANAPVSYSGLRLTSDLLGLGDTLPLGLGGLGGAGGTPNSPPNMDEPPAEEFPPACRVDPGYDCGSTGRANGLPGTTYQVVYGSGFLAPEGEAWTVVPDGCELTEPNFVACASITEPFTTN